MSRETSDTTADGASIHLLELPDSVLTHILSFSHAARDLIHFSESCKLMRQSLTDDCWKRHSSAVRWLHRRRNAESYLEHYRRAQTAGATLTVTGGDWGDNALIPAEYMEAFDPANQEWIGPPSGLIGFSTAAVWRNASCVACDRGIAYLVGGWDEDLEEPLSSVQPFVVPKRTTTTNQMEWPDSRRRGLRRHTVAQRQPIMSPAESALPHLPDLDEPRVFAAATIDAAGRLWVIGGGDAMTRGAHCYNTIVTIDPHAAEPIWQPFGGPPLVAPRCGLSLAADGRHHKLYLVGGYSGGTSYQDTVEILDMSGAGPQDASGRLLPRMRHARSGCGSGVGPDGALYVVGGSANGSEMLSSCERYDPREGVWHGLPDMPTPRGYLSAAFAADGCLYAAGGCSDGWGMPVDAFEAFDTKAGKWRKLPPMKHARSNHTLVWSVEW